MAKLLLSKHCRDKWQTAIISPIFPFICPSFHLSISPSSHSLADPADGIFHLTIYHLFSHPSSTAQWEVLQEGNCLTVLLWLLVRSTWSRFSLLLLSNGLKLYTLIPAKTTSSKTLDSCYLQHRHSNTQPACTRSEETIPLSHDKNILNQRQKARKKSRYLAKKS